MTPKEKALQLAMRFENLVTNWDCFHDVSIDLQDRMPCMKECALICVDEMIEAVRHIVGEKLRAEYYLEVKQEIKKL